MKIKQVWGVYYSATGSTEKLVKFFSTVLAACLHVPVKFRPLNSPADRQPTQSFTDSDLLVVGTPTYAGKVPNKLLPAFQSCLLGNDTPAVAMVSFGNRSYDHALAELCFVLEQNGFHTVGAAACVAQHAMAAQLAANRPTSEDLQFMGRFAEKLAGKLDAADALPPPLCVPGDANAAYYTPLDLQGRKAVFLKATPKTDVEKCTNCKICAYVCPMGSIDPNDVTNITGICIKCHACIKRCPAHAKYFDDDALLSHIAMLCANYTAAKPYETFLSNFSSSVCSE